MAGVKAFITPFFCNFSAHNKATPAPTLHKNILAKYHGEDPVMIKLPAVDGYSTRIMTSSIFWVKTSNDLINNIKQVFPNKVDVKVDSLDKPLEV